LFDFLKYENCILSWTEKVLYHRSYLPIFTGKPTDYTQDPIVNLLLLSKPKAHIYLVPFSILIG
jgi:hypothetical protein